MPGTNEPAAVAEPVSEPVKEVEGKTTLNGVNVKLAETKKEDAGDASNADKAAGVNVDKDVENVDKVSGDAANGEKVSGDAANGEKTGDKVKTPTKEEYETGAALLAQGKRHLYVKDYPSAVAALSEACAKISAEHGQLADDCADGYYYYGSALLELAREEMAVLGEPAENKEGEDDEDDEEEEEEGEEEGGDETLDKSKMEVEEEKKDDGAGTESAEKGEGKESVDKGEEGKDGEEEAGDDENVNDLQLAWEMFDLARVIYERQKDEKKLADTYLKLGEVAMESENYDGAVQDMNKCLELQHKMLSSDNRAIAETLFQLGVASSLCNQFDEAIKYFTNAGAVLDRRIRSLTSSKTADPESVKKDPFYTVEKEVEELRTLLPEIKDKIADMEDFKREALKALREDLSNRMASKDGAGSSSSAATLSSSSSAAATLSSSSAANGSSTSASAAAASPSKAAGPVNDISHLVRKKRKADEVVTEKDSNDAKKPNVEAPSS